MKLKRTAEMSLATAVCVGVALIFFLSRQTGAVPTPLEQFAQTIETTGTVAETIDLTPHAQELFVPGNDAQPYADRLKAAGFKVTLGSDQQGKYIICSRSGSQLFFSGKEHRIIFRLDVGGRIERSESYLFSTWP